MRVAVVVASVGRPKEVAQLLQRLQMQSVQPSQIVLSVESDCDLPTLVPASVLVVRGARGSSAQRNRGIEAVLASCDAIAFFDDDYVPSARVVEGIKTLFSKHPEVVGATGHLLADGIRQGGIAYELAASLVDDFDRARIKEPQIEATMRGAYGCNMAFRTRAIGRERFDENLPLYGWQEDVDFAARLMPRGRLVKTNAFIGVHRGVTSGRTSGLRLGYSQIVNPTYLVLKGTMQWRHALRLMGSNFLANHLRLAYPEPWIDRWGRAKGNWRGVCDIVRGHADPTRILDLHG